MNRSERVPPLHLLLWFGSWKNGLSHYVPDWVKQDPVRFPRVMLDNGKATETISPLGVESRKADARAFAALMAHLKEVDSHDNTVIMVQVENEVGVLGAVRDYSELANSAFHQQVPTALIDGLKRYADDLHPQVRELWERYGRRETGSWCEVFGNNRFAEEYFMAWHYADYINAVAAEGKAQYNLFLYLNRLPVRRERPMPIMLLGNMRESVILLSVSMGSWNRLRLQIWPRLTVPWSNLHL